MALVGILDELLLLSNMYLQVVKFSSKRIVKTCLPEIKKYKQEKRQKDKHQLVDEHNPNVNDDDDDERDVIDVPANTLAKLEPSKCHYTDYQP